MSECQIASATMCDLAGELAGTLQVSHAFSHNTRTAMLYVTIPGGAQFSVHGSTKSVALALRSVADQIEYPRDEARRCPTCSGDGTIVVHAEGRTLTSGCPNCGDGALIEVSP